MKALFFFLFLTCIGTSAFAQNEKIQSDRPGEALTPHLTKKGYFQLEVGFEKEQQNNTDYSTSHPELQLKYGLSNRFEIRTEFAAATERQFSKNEFKYGMKPVEVGLKAKLLEQKGLRPLTTFYTQVGLPKFASADHQTALASPRLKLLFENQFAKSFHLNYNVGAEWDGENPTPRWTYSIDQEVELSKKWEVFVETYAYLQQGEAAQHLIDGGFAFFPTPNTKLDVYAGKGLSKEAPDYFISAGFSFRLK
ncbi:MAG TPA: transporter [Flavisolibacter sp.]|nr:transporter [Flavisolibacter sp.]